MATPAPAAALPAELSLFGTRIRTAGRLAGKGAGAVPKRSVAAGCGGRGRINVNDTLTLAARSRPPRLCAYLSPGPARRVNKGRRGNVIGACGDPRNAAKACRPQTPHRVQKGGLTPSLLSFRRC